MPQDAKDEAWNLSYGRRENFVFAPSDEVVRFISRYLRRRKGLDDFVDVLPGAAKSKILDVGCGIGRNLVFGNQMGLQMWGFDHSDIAVKTAREWLSREGVEGADQRIVSADIRQLPWPGGFFDHALSDSVLDSMSYDIAKAGIAEISRVLKLGGLFYCNLISTLGSPGASNTPGESVVDTAHEQGTIQSYFDEIKARALLEPAFEVVKISLHSIRDYTTEVVTGRWHLVLRRK